MSRQWIALSVVLALAATGEAPAAPGDDQAWKASWSNGHKIEKGKTFQLKFGGRIQADYTFVSADRAVKERFDAASFEDGFEFRRARLFFEGTIYERVKFKAQYDFAGGDASFKDVWIGLDQDWGLVRFGHFKEFFSLEELTSSKYISFLERSLPVEAFAPSRNAGVGVSGSSGDRFNWGTGYFYDADDFGVSTSEDRVNLTGRVAFRPIHEDGGAKLLHVGVAVNNREVEDDGTLRFRARPGAHLTTRLVDTGGLAAEGALIAGLEVAGVFGRLWFASEYMTADVDAPALGDPTFDGAYVQAGYFLTDDRRRFKASGGAFDRQKPGSPWDGSGGRGAWEVLLRLDTLDLTDRGAFGGEQDNVTVGLNWYPNPATRLMINYVRADIDALGESDFVLVRWQVDF